jgi:GDPmannose 4,6-dehydratase
MKKALITGITGQDGSYLSQFLLDKGYQVNGLIGTGEHALCRNLEFLGILNRVNLIQADLLDFGGVVDLLRDIKPDEVYHLAAQSSVAHSFNEPLNTVHFNILSTHHLLEAIRRIEIPTRYYQASSSEMYGRVKQLPVVEDSVLHPVSPYAISKAAGHWLAINYREAYGMFCCCGILFNHESVLRPHYFVTKKIIAAAARIGMGSKEKLVLGNIDIKRDWGYAPEYIRSMWSMLQQDEPDEYVIATNEAHSIREFTEAAFARAGLNWLEHTVIDETLYRRSDIEIIYGDPSKAREKLGWDYKICFEELIGILMEAEISCQKNGFRQM